MSGFVAGWEAEEFAHRLRLFRGLRLWKVGPRAVRHLLAKKPRDADSPRGPELLQGHTALVLESAEILLAERLDSAARVARLTEEETQSLARIVRMGALLHDLGKVSDDFQRMVRGDLDRPQAMRHEAISLWLCWRGQPLWPWLRHGFESDDDAMLAVLVAAAHHRKFAAGAFSHDGGVSGLLLHTDHDEFAATLDVGRRRLGLPVAPRFDRLELCMLARRHPRRQFEEWEIEAGDVVSTPRHRRLLALAKPFVLNADVAGSVFGTGAEKPAWIRKALRTRADQTELEAIVRQRLGGHALRPFQAAVRDADGPLVLVEAGCGTGKTVAAYAWAARNHAGKQVWFTYPTTGTTTEGYRDYVASAEVRARLEHGRRNVDLALLDTGHDDAGSDLDGELEAVFRVRDRLDCLRVWESEVVTATVDTVLGLVQNQRKGCYAWAALLDAAIVFDEIHAYDDRLFGALLRFLEALPGIPALLMTASLPAERRARLQEMALRVHGGPLATLRGPKELEELPRYRAVPLAGLCADRVAALDLVHDAIARGDKVLWVSNTVARAMAVYDALADLEPTAYHSRFRYVDRVRRHDEVIAAFREASAALVCATQVAEMSLDLSADLLVTDLAPVSALVQRLGRLNRRARPGDGLPARPFVVLSVECPLPYCSESLDEARAWLAALGDRTLSQHDLAEEWGVLPRANRGGRPEFSAWWDAPFHTVPAPLREGAHSVEVLLPDDARAVARGTADPVAVVVPLPFPPRCYGSVRTWPRVGHWPVCPDGAVFYDPKRGGKWRVR